MTESLKRISIVLLALAITLGLYSALTLGSTKTVGADAADKVFVCKYVGKPGVDETLQSGDNPINVSINAIKDYPGVGGYFNDAQGRSYVVALDVGQETEPECPAPEVPKKISPVLECVETVGEGQYIARFGYLNRNSFTVDVPVGNDNKITGGGLTGQDQGQTTDFQPGRVVDDFRVEFDGTNLVWTLAYGGQRATSTASASSTPCPQDEEEEYLFQFAKNWDGDWNGDKDKVGFENVEVVFYIGEMEWRIGDDAVEVDPGEVLSPLSEEVTGLPDNCTYESDLPESYPVPGNTEVSTLTSTQDEDVIYTLEVINTVTCTEEGDDGEVLDNSTVATTTTPTSLPNTGNSVATVVALMTAVSAGAAMFSTTLRSALIKFNN